MTFSRYANPLTKFRKGDRFCPLCGRDTYGHRIVDNHYKLKLTLYTGNPDTSVAEREDLHLDLCFKCRNRIYKCIKEEVQKIEGETKRKNFPKCCNCVRRPYCTFFKKDYDMSVPFEEYSIGECPNYDTGIEEEEE